MRFLILCFRYLFEKRLSENSKCEGIGECSSKRYARAFRNSFPLMSLNAAKVRRVAKVLVAKITQSMIEVEKRVDDNPKNFFHQSSIDEPFFEQHGSPGVQSGVLQSRLIFFFAPKVQIFPDFDFFCRSKNHQKSDSSKTRPKSIHNRHPPPPWPPETAFVKKTLIFGLMLTHFP